jgi:peptidoglycan/xylan/chitin deacetylase (PgdA/CDA1 family)
MHHSRQASLSPTGELHIEKRVQVIRDTLGMTPALYRAPWRWMAPWEVARLRKRGLTPIRWDIETPDSAEPRPPGEQVASWTSRRVRPGPILVLHDGIPHGHYRSRPQTVEALRAIVPELRSQSYEFVIVPATLNIPGYQEERAPRDQGDVPLACSEAS